MKKKIFFVLFNIALCSSTYLIAQTGPWLIGGNNLTASRGIGSNNNFALGFRTNGIERARITETGLFGINTKTFENAYQLKVSHGNFGLDIENHSTLNDWELYASATGQFNLYFNESFRGSFDPTSGAYTPISDERLKTSIKLMPAVLEKINQLKPSNYQFKNGNTREYNGFVAQDVMKVFPNLVTHQLAKERNLDVYTLDYSGFGVIAIKGIQELEQVVQKQDQIITALQERIAALEAASGTVNPFNHGSSSSSSAQSTVSASLSSASLDQNIPNPLTSNTSIHYTVPAGSSKAQLVITDNNGNTVKQISLNSGGKGLINIEASTLSAGTYSYTLIVDGKKIDTKKMVIVR